VRQQTKITGMTGGTRARSRLALLSLAVLAPAQAAGSESLLPIGARQRDLND
jgi:hypothetical protein